MVFPQSVPLAHDSSSIRSHPEKIGQHIDSILRANGFWMKLNTKDLLFLMLDGHDIPCRFIPCDFIELRSTIICQYEGIVECE